MELFIKKIIFLFFSSQVLYGDFSEPGPYEVTIISNSLNVSNDESLEYSLFFTSEIENSVYLILIHGFSRNKSIMAGFAQHYASWGIKVITMDLLHSSIIDNDPIQDATDLNFISQQIAGDGPVIYGGHSAGGMRGIIAAQQDINAIAFLGLDLVDAINPSWNDEYLALSHVSNISIPVWGLMAGASSCNANGNGLNVYLEAEYGYAISVIEADHCDFEFPTNLFCTILCQNSNDMFSDNEIRNVILTLSTAYLLFHSGISNDSDQLWYPGNDYFDNQIFSGAIQQMTYLTKDSQNLLPDKIVLYQNYPNPFNPETTIKYDIPNESFITIKIYDVLGNLVRDLVNTNESPGYRSIKWDATNNKGQSVPAGLYLYSILANDFNLTKKMILLK